MQKKWDIIMSSLLKEFCVGINKNIEVGDVLEFGTGSGSSSEYIANNINNKRKIFTFDGFQGLPKTKKGIPINTGWEVGAYCYDEQKIKNKLKRYNNVFVIKTMTNNLKKPMDYGINNIIAANMDLDLYEGTLDGLRFIGDCTWNVLLLRFDDWGCYSHQIASEVDAHEKAAFFDWIEETKYQYEINEKMTNSSRGLQSVIIIKK